MGEAHCNKVRQWGRMVRIVQDYDDKPWHKVDALFSGKLQSQWLGGKNHQNPQGRHKEADDRASRELLVGRRTLRLANA